MCTPAWAYQRQNTSEVLAPSTGQRRPQGFFRQRISASQSIPLNRHRFRVRLSLPLKAGLTDSFSFSVSLRCVPPHLLIRGRIFSAAASTESVFLPDKYPLDGNIPRSLTRHCETRTLLGSGVSVCVGRQIRHGDFGCYRALRFPRCKDKNKQQNIHQQTHPCLSIKDVKNYSPEYNFISKFLTLCPPRLFLLPRLFLKHCFKLVLVRSFLCVCTYL